MCSSVQWPYTGHILDWSQEVATAVHGDLQARLRANFAARESVVNDPAGCDRMLLRKLRTETEQLSEAIAEARERDRVAHEASVDRWRQRQWADDAARWRRDLLRGLLDDARAGELSPGWRDDHWMIQSQLKSVAEAASAEEADVRALVVHEMVTMPVQVWEPHAAGGDWRLALDAWYHDRRRLSDWYACFVYEVYEEMRARWASAPPPPGSVLDLCLGADQAAPIQQSRELENGALEASYEAGLAAGDDPVGAGWRDRYRARLLAVPSGQSSRLVTASLRLLDSCPECWEKLPSYWLQS